MEDKGYFLWQAEFGYSLALDLAWARHDSESFWKSQMCVWFVYFLNRRRSRIKEEEY